MFHKVGIFCERRRSRLYRFHGRLVGRHPLPFLLFPILLSVAMGPGISRRKLNTDVISLFVPWNAASLEEKKAVDQFSQLPSHFSGRSEKFALKSGASNCATYDEKLGHILYEVNVVSRKEENIWRPEILGYLHEKSTEFRETFRFVYEGKQVNVVEVANQYVSLEAAER